jgi:hypothetical protein
MRGITADFARFDAETALLWLRMDTNERLRERAMRLIREGVNQKVIADRMGLSQATFSRWINRKGPPVPVTALDGFKKYTDGLSAALREDAPMDDTPQRDKPAAVGGRRAVPK